MLNNAVLEGVVNMLGAGTATNPYQIRTPAQLAQLATWVNDANATYNDKYYVQTAHLDLSAYSNWTPIGTSTNRFLGQYDGNGLEIRNLTCTGIRAALFGYLSGTLKNIIIASGIVSGTTAGSICAGICVSTTASTNAMISGCVNKANVTGGTIGSNTCYLAGIIGYFGSNGSVTDCLNIGSITNNSTSSGALYAGGIAGGGIASDRTITRCLNAGAITGRGTIKAISGIGGTITNSYYDSTTSGATSSNATGMATANCQGADALSNAAKCINLGTMNWKVTASYPVPVRTR